MAISNRTLSTDVWTTARTALVAETPYVTNTATAVTTAASIVSTYNDKVPSRPQINIEPVDYTEDSYKFNDYEGKKMVNMNIMCYAKNGRQADELKDQVIYTIKRTTFDGMDIVAITTDHAFNTSNNNKYEMTAVNFTFDRE